MSLQPAVQPKPSANGFGRRRVERDPGTRSENKLQSGKSNHGRVANTGALAGGKIGGFENPSRDRLVYITTCLIGHHVEVQVKNGSVYSGIFHATNAEKDMGVILKMACLRKDGTLRGQKAPLEFVSKAPSKTLIIPAKELVQVIAKDVAVTRDGLSNELQCGKQQELMIDTFISQSRHVELERELEPWVPDESDPDCPELENIFDGPWNRGWDQFEANEMLFGVKTTFNEELYTTKLERGPQMRELEKEAMRIAREIEGEETHDLHLAEERGFQLHEKFDIDEETRFSAVVRGGVDDSGYEEEEDIVLNSRNSETFGDSSVSFSKKSTDLTISKGNDGAQMSTSSFLADEAQASQLSAVVDLSRSGSHDHARQLASELPSRISSASDNESRIPETLLSEHGGDGDAKESVEKQKPTEASMSNTSDSILSLNGKIDDSEKGGQSGNVTTCDSSRASSKGKEMPISSSELLEGPVAGKAPGETQTVSSRGRPGSSASSSSDCVGAASAPSAPGLSPSSSMGSLSSEKSTLNPNAKEFKLNPNAKSFTPSHSPVRPPSPVSDGSFYYPANVSAIPHMHGMPVGYGIGPSFTGHQPVIFNPAVAPIQSPQAYFHPNVPQYGQQMLLGQPRQFVYMPSYQPEMPYKGRDY